MQGPFGGVANGKKAERSDDEGTRGGSSEKKSEEMKVEEGIEERLSVKKRHGFASRHNVRWRASFCGNFGV